MKIFVLNSGGSSVKFKILKMPAEEEIASGKVEKLGSKDAIFHLNYDNDSLKEILEIKNHGEAINHILETLIKPEIKVLNKYQEIDVVGHRVVHAGENFTGSVMIDQEVMDTIKMLNKEQNKTIVLITHFMDEAVEADRVIIMDEGELKLDGKPRDVFSKVEEIKRYGLDVPQVTELAKELKKEGIKLSDNIIHIEELVSELCQ